MRYFRNYRISWDPVSLTPDLEMTRWVSILGHESPCNQLQFDYEACHLLLLNKNIDIFSLVRSDQNYKIIITSFYCWHEMFLYLHQTWLPKMLYNLLLLLFQRCLQNWLFQSPIETFGWCSREAPLYMLLICMALDHAINQIFQTANL